MRTIHSHQFDQFIATRRVSADTAAALRRVLVDGERPVHVAEQTGVARSALYRLVKAYHQARPGDVTWTVSCPAGRAERLRQLIDQQVAKWRQEDADMDARIIQAMGTAQGGSHD